LLLIYADVLPLFAISDAGSFSLFFFFDYAAIIRFFFFAALLHFHYFLRFRLFSFDMIFLLPVISPEEKRVKKV